MIVQTSLTPRHEASPPKAIKRAAAVLPRAEARTEEPSLLKIDCFLCSASFVLDVEGHCGKEPPEMEVVGRQFLGVPPDDVLCPRCLDEVETAGAERMYWARAGC